jgi:hypothetical protein
MKTSPLRLDYMGKLRIYVGTIQMPPFSIAFIYVRSNFIFRNFHLLKLLVLSIVCSLCRLITRPEHLIGRHCGTS